MSSYIWTKGFWKLAPWTIILISNHFFNFTRYFLHSIFLIEASSKNSRFRICSFANFLSPQFPPIFSFSFKVPAFLRLGFYANLHQNFSFSCSIFTINNVILCYYWCRWKHFTSNSTKSTLNSRFLLTLSPSFIFSFRVSFSPVKLKSFYPFFFPQIEKIHWTMSLFVFYIYFYRIFA